MRKLLGQVTYSRVVSTLALFVSLGGSAYALSLGKGDVNSRIVKNGSVKSADVHDDGLKGRDIAEGSLATRQFTAAATTPVVVDQPIHCDPETGLTSCGSVTLQTPVAGRILVDVSGELIVPSGGIGSADCRLQLDDKIIGELPLRPRNDQGFAVSGLSEPVAAGAHTAELLCHEGSSGRVEADIFGLTAALIAGA